VYLAEQREPVNRRVALKVIKLGMDTQQVVARFEAERQALAMMDHPSIAHMFDGGVTAAGRPFFVMELVQGVKITDYCNHHHFSARDRVELFIQVCQGVQHAHQKGIIHRDLKPSNILVSEPAPGAMGLPKIIDFGIAKALVGRLTDKTVFTGFQHLIGTPAYMSPEQAALTNLDIDTRTDIYSLGVLLYELLTGRTPFDTQELVGAGLEELCRTIREKEPTRPSTRLRGLSRQDLDVAARQRDCEPPKLISAIRGDLDWIVMKCLEKDRARRYDTVQSLANDLTHYLRNEPVTARPPSVSYRLAKFSVRHRVGVAAAATIVLLLLAGLAASISLAAWANRERKQAVAAEANTHAVLDFFQEKVLVAGRPAGQAGGLGREVTLRAAVDAAEPSISGAFTNQPLVEASIREVLGRTYNFLGEYELAIAQHQRCLDLRRGLLGVENLETISALNNLAEDLRLLGRAAEGIPLMEEALRAARRIWEVSDTNTLSVMNDLGLLYAEAGRMEDSVKLLGETLGLRRRHLAPEHPDTMVSIHNLGDVYRALGRDREALPLLEESLAVARKLHGPTNADTLTVMNNLALVYSAVGDSQRAAALHEQVLTNRVALLGQDHQYTLGSMNGVAMAWRELGKFKEALDLLEQAAARARQALEPDHPYTITFHNNVALAAEDAGETNKALLLFEQTLQQRCAVRGLEHPETLRAMNYLARCRLRCGQLAQADALLVDAERKWRSSAPNDGPVAALTLANRSECCLRQGRYEDAEKFAREYVTFLDTRPQRPWSKAEATGLLGAALLGQRRFAEAEPKLLSSFNDLEAIYSCVPAHTGPRLRQSIGRSLTQLYEQSGQDELAGQWKKRLGPSPNSKAP
jgi:tetratricopeptide (TPR) repeat protein